MEKADAPETALLKKIRHLQQLSVGTCEPAVAFRPLLWSAPEPTGIDLEAIARGAADDATPEDASGPTASDTASAASDHDHDADRDRAVGESPPPPLPGVIETAARFNRGELGGLEILERTRARIAAYDATLNALVTETAGRAAAEVETLRLARDAGERPRPLAGVPVVHKDILLTAGTRTTAGSLLLHDFIPRADATVVSHLANAGALTMAKANTHEFASGTTGEVSSHGATRNPWNLDHMTGGSSSGSAAAVAAGLVPAATGTDTGGSIRIPAACCGVVGLKPTYGRVSRVGAIPFAWSLDHVGPIARCVEDVGALFAAMAGHDPFDPASANEPRIDPHSLASAKISGLRFAMPADWLREATDEVAAALTETGIKLEQLGLRCVEIEPPFDLPVAGSVAAAIFLSESHALHAPTLERFGNLYQEPTRRLLRLGGQIPATSYLAATRLRQQLGKALARVMTATDLLLLPTLPITAPPLGVAVVDGVRGPLDVRSALTLFTRPFNLTGQPALTLPCGFTDDGLPIGAQIVGRPFDEASVLAVARGLEEATEWHQHRPADYWPD